MSTQEFKPGDRVRLRDGASPVSGHQGTREFTVEAMSLSGRAVALVGVGGYRGIDRFELDEPEPLKEGEGWGILARQVGKASHYRFTDGDRVIFDGMAVVEPDGYGFTLKPWVEEPTTDYAIVRDGFRTLVRLPIDQRQPGAIYRPWVVVGSDIACAWDDLGEHVVVSGGAS